MKNKQGGFLAFFLIIIIAAVGAMYFIKDDNGVSYLQKAVDKVTGAKDEVYDKAYGTRDLQNEHNAEIDAMIDSI